MACVCVHIHVFYHAWYICVGWVGIAIQYSEGGELFTFWIRGNEIRMNNLYFYSSSSTAVALRLNLRNEAFPVNDLLNPGVVIRQADTRRWRQVGRHPCYRRQAGVTVRCY